MLRYVLQIDADARPRVKASAHRVDEHVGRFEVRRGIRMSRAPALEPRKRSFFFLRAADFNQRIFRRAAPRRLDALRLARLLAVMRRPRRVAQALLLVPRRQLQERL